MISLDPPVRLDEKPPDYASVVDVPPPSYDDAIKLDPQRLMTAAECGHRAADACAITVPDECCDKASTDGAVTAADAAPDASSQQQPTTALARAIRKSIRDIRKQLTNTVTDVTAAVDVEHQQQQQQQQQHSGGSEQNVPDAAAALKSNVSLV